MGKIVFITGATSGFGKASAYKFAANGYDLIINGRRTERLDQLASELENKYNVAVITLPFDVRDEQAVFSSIGSLTDQWKAIDVLVNNAGLALGRDYFEEASLEDWNTMIDTNIKGVMYVARAVANLMVPRKQGHILKKHSGFDNISHCQSCFFKNVFDILQRLACLPFYAFRHLSRSGINRQLTGHKYHTIGFYRLTIRADSPRSFLTANYFFHIYFFFLFTEFQR